jgi:hypothetical protein
MTSVVLSQEAATARERAMILLAESGAEIAEDALVTVARAQVWATLAVSLELASGVETFEDGA